MSLSSMTGYARASAALDALHWQWDIKSVNGKSLDVRCRLPPGFETLDLPVREIAQKHLKRGNVQIGFTADRGGAEQALAVNEAALEQVVALAERLRERLGGAPPQIENLLALRGIIDVASPVEDEAQTARRDKAILKSVEEAFQALAVMRKAEGAKLAAILGQHLDRIEKLVIAARDNPARTVEAIRARLGEQVSRLMETNSSFDRDRLHQEAVLLATRADIVEEIDRLFAHIEAARKLVQSKEPAGRQLDFLAQEFNREANTLCSKASDKSLTAIGLELKTVIDQMREQVQNIE
ncbi:YicC/YloC family endoribonuclease [Taklimakanibacter albus]|uniref:YicC family protein n=1 Tax=Taklimakanibacter albus TaxID=2800327 RepID=A0ACC5R090_9HYPH|nr:YicC/YloC family endoribonuclease [Aestuariivirga sp. YIM B02566]MBK1866028.1 YicC family protein [Aestuariivirga sp. YIM B02566]